MALTFDGSTNTISGLVINSANITDGSIVNADISASAAIASTKLSGVTSGITMADQWRITASYTNSGTNFITANWERVDNSIFGQIGTGMTESSGVFTFPSTGIYFVNFFTTHRQVNGTSMYNGIQFHTTTNNSSYTMIANAYDSVAQTAYFASTALSHIVDITNTSTHKIKFAHVAASSSNIDGNTDETMTGVTFIRLGDT